MDAADRVDCGVRVFSLRNCNQFALGLPVAAYDQSLLSLLEQSHLAQESLTNHPGDDSNIEQMSLLFTALLRLGLPLNLPLAVSVLGRYTIFEYGGEGLLVACLDQAIETDLISALAAQERQPERLLLRESGFVSDSAKINCMELCSMFLPNTLVKVI